MRVQVDREKCQGHNRCSMTCPEVFKVDDEGYAYVEREEVPSGLEAQARRAAEGCPEEAITVFEARAAERTA